MRTRGALALCLLSLGALCRVPRADDQPPEEQPEPGHFTVAVFRFANQTYHPELQALEAGIADIIAQTLDLHPQIEVVDSQRLDRAIRRHGLNPARPVPYGEAAAIAGELDADRAISGTLTQFNAEVRVEPQMVLLSDTGYEWTPSRTLTQAADPVPIAVELARELMSRLPVDPEVVEARFLVGSHVTIEVSSTAAELGLRLANGPDEAHVWLRSYKITEGKTLGRVEWDPDSGALLIAAAEGTSNPNWTVRFDAVVTCSAPELRLGLAGSAGSETELKITNESIRGESRLVKSFKMGRDTPRADVLVSADQLMRDSPVYLLATPFGPADGSIPLHVGVPQTAPGTATAPGGS